MTRAPFSGPVDAVLFPLGTMWRRWHWRFNAFERISPGQAWSVLGRFGVMRELDRARRAA